MKQSDSKGLFFCVIMLVAIIIFLFVAGERETQPEEIPVLNEESIEVALDFYAEQECLTRVYKTDEYRWKDTECEFEVDDETRVVTQSDNPEVIVKCQKKIAKEKRFKDGYHDQEIGKFVCVQHETEFKGRGGGMSKHGYDCDDVCWKTWNGRYAELPREVYEKETDHYWWSEDNEDECQYVTECWYDGNWIVFNEHLIKEFSYEDFGLSSDFLL